MLLDGVSATERALWIGAVKDALWWRTTAPGRIMHTFGCVYTQFCCANGVVAVVEDLCKMNATIALANDQDRDVLVALLAAQLHAHHIALSCERLAAAVDGALSDAERGLFLVARVQGTAVGVAYLSFTWTLEHGGKSCWLEELYVMPAYRERGIGRQLLDAVCQHAAELGCAAVDLEVEEEHARAQHLYEREGFRPHRRQRWVRILATQL